MKITFPAWYVLMAIEQLSRVSNSGRFAEKLQVKGGSSVAMNVILFLLVMTGVRALKDFYSKEFPVAEPASAESD